MANLQINASQIMERVTEYAPVGLLLLAFLSFFATGIFSVDYYDNLFVSRFKSYSFHIAILIAIIQEAIRFCLLVSSIRDFSDDKKFNGWLGLLGSIGLVCHDLKLGWEVAIMWSSNNPNPYYNVFVFLILIGLLLELRLVLTTSITKKQLPLLKKSKPTNGAYTVINN